MRGEGIFYYIYTSFYEKRAHILAKKKIILAQMRILGLYVWSNQKKVVSLQPKNRTQARIRQRIRLIGLMGPIGLIGRIGTRAEVINRTKDKITI